MNKIVKWMLIIIAGLAVLLFIAFNVMKSQTKKASPEETITYDQGDLQIEVYYNRPSKKGRAIFGELVPYNEVWRTGANEATTFETNQAITFGGKPLAAGKYTLWTIPGTDSWQVILNDKQYGWGVKFSDGKAARDPEADVLQVEAPVESLTNPVELFTISFDQSPSQGLVIEWDQVRVKVPISK